ncbi:MAG: hypothetical protein ACJ73E_07265 [Mycobacteriales bacterium]
MALTVRPDDEVYQFDTVWLGPDEYTLPIQARYVAWGTWLACFLVAAAILVPLGGGGPAGVLGSLVWALGLSVVLSRAVMLVVDHERPLRSLPALFSAEARAALAARRRAERALLVRPARVRVRTTPAKVLAIRDRQRRRAEAKASRRRKPAPVPEVAVVEPVEEAAVGPDRRPGRPPRPEWPPDLAAAASHHDGNGGQAEPVPGWSVPGPAGTRQPVIPVLAAALPSARARPPTRVAPTPPKEDRRSRADNRDRQAAVEARILLPARKDR